MSERKPKITEDVQRLIDMDSEMIFAKDIAPVIHMNPDVIIKYAKDGTWDQDHLGKFVLSGDRVKFFRKDFLQKCGFIGKEPEAKTVEQLLTEIVEQMKRQNKILMAMMDVGQTLKFSLMNEEEAANE